ncbi:MAG TPA: endonuclease III [Flavitalea sp.]|nr:endonuclease III [Flavitalea sp.]
MPAKTDWVKAIQPLLKKYKGIKHPLEYKNTYQLVVMVILAAQDSDKHINQLSEELFKAIPDMKKLAKHTAETLIPYIKKIRNHRNKANWLVKIAQQVKTDSKIPKNLDELTELPGIGRKSANVILRESGLPAEGIMVDLHTVRVAPRLGIVDSTDPKKIEQELMEILPQKFWDAGMALSFHGRDICRPKPLCEICLMRPVCEYYKKVISKIK